MATGDELKKAGATKYVRGSCTDQSWRSSECPQFCIDPNVDNLTGGNGIGKCLGTTQDMYYCTGTGNTDNNCSASQNPLIFQGVLNLVLDKSYILTYAGQPSALTTIGVTATSSTATKSATITTTLSTAIISASASASQTAATTQSATTDHTTAIAAGVAAPLGVIALGLGAFLYYRYGRKQSNSKLIPSEYQAVPPSTYHDETVKYAQYPESGPAGKQLHYEALALEIQEAPAHNALVELPNDSVSYELGVNSPTREGSKPSGNTQ